MDAITYEFHDFGDHWQAVRWSMTHRAGQLIPDLRAVPLGRFPDPVAAAKACAEDHRNMRLRALATGASVRIVRMLRPEGTRR